MLYAVQFTPYEHGASAVIEVQEVSGGGRRGVPLAPLASPPAFTDLGFVGFSPGPFFGLLFWG
jgi:hypothetical protein